MRFNQNARLDTGQVRDRRGMGGPIAAGGGVVGLLIAVAVVLLGGDPSTLDPSTLDPSRGRQGQSLSLGQSSSGNLAGSCRTGADANQSQDCRIVGVVNSIQAYWRSAVRYDDAPTVLFTNRVATGCGSATSAVGPFYCPRDATVYIDLGFFQELESQFGAAGGPFAEAYVLGHEYGHHIQNLDGTDERVDQRDTGPASSQVRSELQADCYAGVWAANAVASGFIESLSDEDIAVGLDAAAAIGDDRIQAGAGQGVNPHSWTHGSAEQRQRWFRTGLRSGTPSACDTWSVAQP